MYLSMRNTLRNSYIAPGAKLQVSTVASSPKNSRFEEKMSLAANLSQQKGNATHTYNRSQPKQNGTSLEDVRNLIKNSCIF